MDLQLIVPKDGSPPKAMRVVDRVITVADFPPTDTARWVISRKTILAGAVVCGLKSAQDLAADYDNLSLAELESWVKTLREEGFAGLRATHVQELSQQLIDDSLPAPVDEFYIAEADGLVLTSDGTMRNGGETQIAFTKSETRLLGYMMLNPGIVISKSALLRVMYPNGKQAEQKILDVFVCKIRRKIRSAFEIDIIETCWGRGYMVP